MMSKVAVIAGSSGMVGTELLLLRLCASDAYSGIKLLVRKPSGFRHSKVKEYIVDFDRIENFASVISGDVFFSCLGTTRKKTPDQQAYYRIDHDYPLRMAKIALTNGIPQFHLISSIGADPGASGFYLRMKGATERDIAALPLDALHIYRPSFLDGNREERRPLEKAALALFRLINPLLRGRWRKYRSIKADDVAQAMIGQSLLPAAGVHYYESDEIQRLSNRRE